jgi:hypothetical protein
MAAAATQGRKPKVNLFFTETSKGDKENARPKPTRDAEQAMPLFRDR